MTCAYAVRGALKKLPAVESVEVSLNKGLASLRLKPGNTLQPPAIWEAVRKNGFTPKETRVVVRGEVVSSGGKPQLRVTGTNQVYDLIAEANAARVLEDVQRETGRTVVVEGTLWPPKDAKTAVPLQVTTLRLAAEKGK